MKAPKQQRDDGTEGNIKTRFMDGVKVFGEAGASLRELAEEAVDADYSREDLIEWAIEAGADKAYASRMVSSLFLAAGKRARKSGAGPKVSPEAQEIAAYLTAKYGAEACKIARAAARLLSGQTGTNVSTVKVEKAA